MKRLCIIAGLLLALVAPASAQFTGGNSFGTPGFTAIKAAGASLACSYTPVTTGTQGTAYTGATPSASGGTPAYTFSETGTLPGGLSISSSTGVISGTPTANGSFPTIQVKVTDSTSTVVNCGALFTLVIAPPAGLMLDGITAGIKGAYSTRKLLTAYAGNAVQVTRNSDLTTSNIGFVSNLLDTTSLSTFCSGTICHVTTWFDQSGNGNDLTQVTSGNAPIIYQSGAVNFINTTRPALFLNGGHSLKNASLSQNPTNTLFMNAVSAFLSAAGGPGAIVGGTAGNNLEWRVDNSTLIMELLADATAGLGTATIAQTTTGSVLELQYNSSTGAGSFWVDAAAAGTFTSAHTFAGSTQMQIGLDSPSSEGFDGSLGEVVMYDLVGGIPSGSRTSIEANQKAYWGTP